MGLEKYENVGEYQPVLHHERSHHLHPHPITRMVGAGVEGVESVDVSLLLYDQVRG
jgi:hypothetical protein